MPTDPDRSAPQGGQSDAGHAALAVQIVSTLHNDPRLLIGAGVIAGHSAQQAGLSETAQDHLAAATTQACLEVFALAGADPKSPAELNMKASRFPDRIEIAIALSAVPAKPEAHSQRTQERGGKHPGKLLDEGLVDRVQRETRDGRPTIVLVKYCRPVKSKV
ncbi:MAG TPA: hypothetical protein VHX36_06100 [Candidatus Acidoferrales bacterium]|jgi:hypothetical protein|nr:hypothetical protein [Candidatus Acidoferrales bacterium]